MSDHRIVEGRGRYTANLAHDDAYHHRARDGRSALARPVDDCGPVINHTIVEGQVHGGVAQGIGQALFEEIVYDRYGNLLTTNFTDYTIPSAADLPDIEALLVETPSPRNVLGAKGVGESGPIGALPAVLNAIVDALTPLGVTFVDMPATPERVWRALQSARSR